MPRSVIEHLIKQLDPEGVEQRKAHKLRRITYHNRGPNDVWHCDGYDKLKPFGFPIHACIDGWSRKILWLYVTRSNNLPQNIEAYYLETVRQLHERLPHEIGDGSWNREWYHGFITVLFSRRYSQSSLRTIPKKSKNRGLVVLFEEKQNYLVDEDLADQQVFNRASELQSECLWFIFASLLQADLDCVKEHWNTHYIRKSRYDTVAGRPDSLYFLPEVNGGVSDIILPVPEHDMVYAQTHVEDNADHNVFQEYFHYVINTCELQTPGNWRDGLHIYTIYYLIMRTIECSYFI